MLGRPLNKRNMKADLRRLCLKGNAVLVKSIGESDGGKAAGCSCEGGVLRDYFYSPSGDRMRIFSKKYITTNNRNGTGDTLASAIATYLARGFELEDAVAYSEKFIQKAIAAGANYDFGSGFGGTQPFFRDVARYERETERYKAGK